jgi:Family of unknown function (DUF6098)
VPPGRSLWHRYGANRMAASRHSVKSWLLAVGADRDKNQHDGTGRRSDLMVAMPTVWTLDELTELARQHPGMFVRWSRGPDADVAGQSSDELTGSRLPGLSANPLAVEEWWGDRPLRLWIARRLHDYSHLEHEKAPDVRPWVLAGEELSRGPDNEPVVRCQRPVAWVANEVIAEADRVLQDRNTDWGSLRRAGSDR